MRPNERMAGAMSDREQSCEQRIGAQMDGREKQFRALLSLDDLEPQQVIAAWSEYHSLTDEQQSVIDAYARLIGEEGYESFSDLTDEQQEADIDYDGLIDELREELRDEQGQRIDESILGLSTRVMLRIELSTGGPGDWVEAEIDPDTRSVEEATYHFNDWFDHAERPIDIDSPLWQLAEYYAETVELPGDSRERSY